MKDMKNGFIGVLRYIIPGIRTLRERVDSAANQTGR